MRIMPPKIRAGDSLLLEVSMGSLPEDEEWSRLDLAMRLVSEEEVEELDPPIQGTLDSQIGEIELSAAQTAGLRDALWRYRIYGTGANGSVRTLEGGLVDVEDPLNPSPNRSQKMVGILKDVIEAKLTGRGDILEYMIEGRNTRTMHLEELQTMLSHYEVRVSRARKRRRKW